jgi:hypothetical protein
MVANHLYESGTLPCATFLNTRWWATGPIHEDVGQTFRSLITAFHGVLVLVVWFTGPLPNTVGTEDIEDPAATEGDGVVAQETSGCAAVTNSTLGATFIGFARSDPTCHIVSTLIDAQGRIRL